MYEYSIINNVSLAGISAVTCTINCTTVECYNVHSTVLVLLNVHARFQLKIQPHEKIHSL